MDSASRLYERLGNIPQDPDDPESLEDLLVCAFGAFERFYLCWKTKGGEHRQDCYELPKALYEWLFPADGSHRDFATLQVVFGRGEEYFASDKDGKLEHKEPEPKPAETATKEEKPGFRRSRTMSFLRPHASSDPSPSAANPPLDTTSNDLTHRRFSSVSQTPSPPVSIPTSRPTSDPLPKSSNQLIDAIQSPEPNRRMYYIAQTYSKPISTSSSRPISTYSTYSSDGDAESSLDMDPAPDTQKITTPRLVRRSTRPLSISFNPSNIPKIPEERRKPSPEPGKDDQPEQQHCPCCRHNSIQKPTTYVDASIQTDPEPLRITTTGVSRATNSNLSSALDTDTPLTDDELPLPPPAPNPVIMGRMFDYFSNPGYQLGDSLMSSYHFNYYPQKQAIYSGDAFYVG